MLTFYDHFISDSEKEIICEVPGLFLGEDENYYHFSWWKVVTNDKELFENNLEKFSVLRGAIIKTKNL